ncbi:hypothetical protein PHLGIDRAFT_130592 [Phlebiopsis gigantea 11061_1 CR5-6]|uniref:SUN domain-containing protein n=1 Tax=Phlebiopsis gigantea (strain 11061_1 CR5-6) TaxID=745531 RepID=A0A0C3S405_PHLG1|nr:hypothetical protein PHLGIDRAFT_130592 [Phlebiopsis gigantea 11061_1 CR5-6]
MRPLRTLPIPLLALLFALPVLSEPSTPNDPFHDVAAQTKKEPEPPICCLRPLSPLESTEEEVLLSFEEWKAKQASGERGIVVSPPAPTAVLPKVNDNVSEAAASSEQSGVPPSTVPTEQTEAPVPDAPYFHIPLTDRFNYASLDCSARVHTTHKGAKSASSILSSKKDRYMLSPCAASDQFVVVELCEDIRIDTVQLADYEFFSGVFKDFTVSVAKTHTMDPASWTFAGTYRAKNVRGVQSFHPPKTLNDFYRFIRIDFHSHYGNEYYCPLSLLRVYGLTHLEQWKWEVWEAESKARLALEFSQSHLVEAAEEVPPSTLSKVWSDLLPEPPVRVVPTIPIEVAPVLGLQSDISILSTSPADIHIETTLPSAADSISLPPPAYTPSPSILSGAHVVGAPDTSVNPATSEHPPASSHSSDSSTDTTHDPPREHTTDSLYTTTTISSDAHQPQLVSLSHPSSAHSGLSSPPVSRLGSPHVASSSVSVFSSSNQSSHITRPSSTPSAIPTVTHSLTVISPPPSATSGESIYRTIMNRLTALESNTSLYARFVEDHAASVREMLRRLNEDIGRLEGIGKAQAQMYQRTVGQFERQQRRLELEHNELLSKVSRLTDEVILEKRLGIAQLCLLLAVLVFMALTRGSRSEPLHGPTGDARSRTSSLRGWGTRTLNLSGDWVSRFRTRSLSPASTSTKTEAQSARTPAGLEPKTTFPSQGVQVGELFPRSKRPHPMTGRLARPHTPSSARARQPLAHSPTPTAPRSAGLLALRPPLHRAHSSAIAIAPSLSTGVIGPVPKSARRWARTAHLHEVKSGGAARVARAASEDGDVRASASASGNGSAGLEDVFGGPSRTLPVDGGEGDGWVDTDADESDAEAVKANIAQ